MALSPLIQCIKKPPEMEGKREDFYCNGSKNLGVIANGDPPASLPLQRLVCTMIIALESQIEGIGAEGGT